MDVVFATANSSRWLPPSDPIHQAYRWSKDPLGNRSLLLLVTRKPWWYSLSAKAEQQPGGVGLLLCFGETSERRVVTAARCLSGIRCAAFPASRGFLYPACIKLFTRAPSKCILLI